MAGVVQLIPNDPDGKEPVLAVLRKHPELQDFIANVRETAEEVFQEIATSLDTVQYDD